MNALSVCSEGEAHLLRIGPTIAWASRVSSPSGRRSDWLLRLVAAHVWGLRVNRRLTRKRRVFPLILGLKLGPGFLEVRDGVHLRLIRFSSRFCDGRVGLCLHGGDSSSLRLGGGLLNRNLSPLQQRVSVRNTSSHVDPSRRHQTNASEELPGDGLVQAPSGFGSSIFLIFLVAIEGALRGEHVIVRRI